MKYLIANNSLSITNSHNQTHFRIPIEINYEYRVIYITFEYSPNISNSTYAKEKITAHLNDMRDNKSGSDLDLDKAENYLPLNNLITLSIVKDGKYIGNRHCKKSYQEISISSFKSSLGFSKVPTTQGVYELVFSCHAILSNEVLLNYYVEGKQ